MRFKSISVILTVLLEISVCGQRASAHCDLALGRWLEEDPAGYADGMSLYLTYRDSPVALTDPGGLVAVYDTYPFVPGRGKFIVGTLDSEEIGWDDKTNQRTYNAGGADFHLQFMPDPIVTAPDSCLCTRIDFVQYEKGDETRFGFSAWNDWELDGTDPYGNGPKGGQNIPWVKGGNAPASMEDAPDLVFGQTTLNYQFKSEAICRDGQDKNKSYGTVEWSIDINSSGNYKKFDLVSAGSDKGPMSKVIHLSFSGRYTPDH